MSNIMHAGRSMLDMLLLIAVGLVPVISGLLVMVYQLEAKLEENANVSVQEAVFSVDQALDRMLESALRAMPYAGKPCATAQKDLLDQAASRSMIRSLTLVKNNKSYCSTTSEPLDHLSSFAQTGRQVEISYGPPDKRQNLLINFHLSERNKGVIVTAYAMQIRDELAGFQDGLALLLEVGDRYISNKGDSRDRQRPSKTEFPAIAQSDKYGYRIKGGYPDGFTAQEIHQSMLKILPSLILVGMVTVAMVYMGLLRQRGGRHKSAASHA